MDKKKKHSSKTGKPPLTRKKPKLRFPFVLKTGILHIKSTYNNTIASLTDGAGNVICWSSAGEAKPGPLRTSKLTGSKKKTEYAAYTAILSACLKGVRFGLKEVEVNICEYGNASNVFAQAITAANLHILGVTDVTSLAHNGCRAPKAQRKKHAEKKRRKKHYEKDDSDSEENDQAPDKKRFKTKRPYSTSK